MRVTAWFDDIILFANSVNLILEQIYFAKLLIQSRRFLINENKSSLTPSQSIYHLGYIWDSVEFTLSVPVDKVQILKKQFAKALECPVSSRFLQTILGTIESFRIAFPFAALYYRGLQHDVATSISSGSSWDLILSPSKRAKEDLSWWVLCPTSLPPSSLEPFIPQLVITTDSSRRGWGAFTSTGEEVYGFWSKEESSMHNNILETHAVFLAFQSLM